MTFRSLLKQLAGAEVPRLPEDNTIRQEGPTKYSGATWLRSESRVRSRLTFVCYEIDISNRHVNKAQSESQAILTHYKRTCLGSAPLVTRLTAYDASR